MTRRRRRVRPDSLGLEERVVLSGSGAASAAVASAGAPASNLAALAAFGEQARQGLTPTLTVRFGEATASAGTLVLPDASYSAGLGYGWLSNPGKITIRDGVATGRSGDFELDVPPGTYDVTVTPAASRDRGLDSQVTAFAAGDTLGGPGAFFSEPPHAMTLRHDRLTSRCRQRPDRCAQSGIRRPFHPGGARAECWPRRTLHLHPAGHGPGNGPRRVAQRQAGLDRRRRRRPSCCPRAGPSPSTRRTSRLRNPAPTARTTGRSTSPGPHSRAFRTPRPTTRRWGALSRRSRMCRSGTPAARSTSTRQTAVSSWSFTVPPIPRCRSAT